MAMTNRHNQKRDCFIIYTLNDLVPQDHLVRKLDDAIDFNFIYDKVKHLYSPIGRPSIDPVVLFKLLFINIIFGFNSMRRTCDEALCNVAYRWFLGLSIDESIPDYSTWSQNYIRRYHDSSVFEEIFYTILQQAIDYGFVDTKTAFGDSTHQKANANKNKSQNVEVEIVKKYYEDQLLKEINEDRECTGNKQFDSLVKVELEYDAETGEIKENKKTKTITQSVTDPESGCFHKGEKERCFAYSHQTFCDRYGFVLEVSTVPGNVHDSASFFQAYNHLMEHFKGTIENISLDAGYITPAICKQILEDNMTPYMPYKRPMTKKGYLKKYEFVYDEVYDQYICPNTKLLSYTITNKEGYRVYQADKKDCMKCPFKDRCTKSEKKSITRHLWEEYVERANEVRYSDEWKEIYPQRKQSIERVFADCKENNGLRYTRLRGLKKNQHNIWLIFACHNLKRMSLWRTKKKKSTPKKEVDSCFFTNKMKNDASLWNEASSCANTLLKTGTLSTV